MKRNSFSNRGKIRGNFRFISNVFGQKHNNFVDIIYGHAHGVQFAFLVVAIAVLLIATAPLSSVQAQQTNENKGWSVGGIGGDSCGSYLSAAESTSSGENSAIKYNGKIWYDKRTSYTQWILGYISALNATYYNIPQLQIRVNFSVTDLWIREWCNTHPADMVWAATTAFVKERWAVQSNHPPATGGAGK